MWETKRSAQGCHIFSKTKVSSRPHKDAAASSELIFTGTCSVLHSSAASQKQPHRMMEMLNVNPELIVIVSAAFETIATVSQQLHQ